MLFGESRLAIGSIYCMNVCGPVITSPLAAAHAAADLWGWGVMGK